MKTNLICKNIDFYLIWSLNNVIGVCNYSNAQRKIENRLIALLLYAQI